MPNTTVTVIRHCRIDPPAGSIGKPAWKRLPVVKSKNGRIRPGYVLLNGQQVHRPVGHYELRFYQGRTLRYESVGEDAQEADNARDRKAYLLKARNAAEEAGVTITEAVARRTLRSAAVLYIQDRQNQGAMEAARQAQNVTEEFIATSCKTYLDEVTRQDIYDFHARCRKHGLSDRTVANKHDRLRSFFRFCEVAVDKIMPPKPTYEKQLPTIYTREQMDSLIGVANPYMGLVVKLGFMCGLREMEMVHLEWRDINWSDKLIRVQGKPYWNFKVKDSEQRDVPVPNELLADLAGWKEVHGKRLILGTKADRPNTHLLRQLKRLVNRAGLHCGACSGCDTSKECAEWTLHKLRRTYATTVLREADVRTVQHFMGHSDLASTTRYLRPVGSKEMQSLITSIFSSAKPKTVPLRTTTVYSLESLVTD